MPDLAEICLKRGRGTSIVSYNSRRGCIRGGSAQSSSYAFNNSRSSSIGNHSGIMSSDFGVTNSQASL